MLPTMRYDPDREVVRIWPQKDDQHAPYLVTRYAIEQRVGSRSRLSLDELIDACEEHEAYFALVATRKLIRGEVDPDGRAVVMALDVTETD
jgi:hypothetical protein